MADDDKKRSQAEQNQGSFVKLSNGTSAIQRAAVMAASHRSNDERRVPPLTDFTANTNLLPPPENIVVTPGRSKSVVEAAAATVAGVSGPLGKKS